MEDIANTGQRPKLEVGEKHIFLTMKMLYNDNSTNGILSEQFSFVFGNNYVLSFQERIGDVFEPVRERLRKTIPRTRFSKPDYLAYSFIDAIVDHYFVVLENIASTIYRELKTRINEQTASIESIEVWESPDAWITFFPD